ncbi:hypothetical protein EV356DRAFT_251153 [Viridothelium virens]|uniref:Uncharacterized protein n=1 Tax=Viridothelium virens TaxID=1048519 RepID=A0A6A6H3U6_VIRVR|nr:hypothetical protein EV356DRAFT_251153 [Viridothelium virens]
MFYEVHKRAPIPKLSIASRRGTVSEAGVKSLGLITLTFLVSTSLSGRRKMAYQSLETFNPSSPRHPRIETKAWVVSSRWGVIDSICAPRL